METQKTSSHSSHFKLEESFRDGKKGYILCVGRFGKSVEESIENVYHVSGLNYSLLSVSQICDNGNEVRFTFEKGTVVNLITKEWF